MIYRFLDVGTWMLVVVRFCGKGCLVLRLVEVLVRLCDIATYDVCLGKRRGKSSEWYMLGLSEVIRHMLID